MAGTDPDLAAETNKPEAKALKQTTANRLGSSDHLEREGGVEGGEIHGGGFFRAGEDYECGTDEHRTVEQRTVAHPTG